MTKRTSKAIIRVCTVIFCLVMVVSLVMIGIRMYRKMKADSGFEDIRSESSEVISDTSSETVREKKYYLDVYEKNNDTVGWIKIEGTKIDYPVMQTLDDYDYYIKRDFNRQGSDWGVPFVGFACNALKPSDNVNIYGHHMKDGSMFAALVNYESRNFYEQHKIIHFDTLYELGTYEIVCVTKTVVYTNDDPFPFYRYTDFSGEDEFNEYISTARKYQVFDTGVEAHYGDKLITLITCEYSHTDGRMLIIAKKIN